MSKPVPCVVYTALLLVMSGCSTYSDATLRRAESVYVTQNDITDRPYRNLGDLKVVVRKPTIFNSDPTPDQIDEELRKKAASLGANAVVLVRYGTVGIGFTSWGVLEGAGRAVLVCLPGAFYC